MELPQSFIRSLKAGLEKRQQENQYFHLHPPAMELGLVDFGSNDSLSIRNSGCVRERFLDELDATPDFALGAGGSRVLDGSNGHVMKLERYLADYHGAEDGLFFNSGYEANVAIHSNLPQPGDVIIHDSLIHTSIRDGIRGSRASIVKSFAHNDVDSLGHVVDEIKKTSPVIAQGHQTVFVVFESFYSMEGDMSPVADILSRVRELLPFGNCAFIIDEAHSTGLIGPQGSGYINHLKLQDEGIIQMHSYAKAPGAHGAIVLCHPMVKEYLTNYARSLMYSTGPSFPTIAMLHASVDTLRRSEGQRRRRQLRKRMKYFYECLLQNPNLDLVQRSGILKFPTIKEDHPLKFHIPIIPILTGYGLCLDLQRELREHGFLTHALQHPVVPKDGERLRVMMHANNTPDDISKLIGTLMNWGVINVNAIAKSRL